MEQMVGEDRLVEVLTAQERSLRFETLRLERLTRRLAILASVKDALERERDDCEDEIRADDWRARIAANEIEQQQLRIDAIHLGRIHQSLKDAVSVQRELLAKAQARRARARQDEAALLDLLRKPSRAAA